MQSYYSKEPIGLVDFVAAKTNAIVQAEQGRRDVEALRALIASANQKGLNEARGWLEPYLES